jgi:hypothetical protein
MTWYLWLAAALGVAATAIGLKIWWREDGRSEYEAWALRGGRGPGEQGGYCLGGGRTGARTGRPTDWRWLEPGPDDGRAPDRTHG